MNKSILTYFEDKLSQHGATARGVDWNSEESQHLRFDILLKNFSTKFSSVMDYGCGYGAMLPALRQCGFTGQFTGYDFSEKMIQEAKKTYNQDAMANWISQIDETKYDYIIASGIFNLRLNENDANWEKYILDTLKIFHEKSTHGFSCNFLTSYSDIEKMRKDLYYTNPAMVFDFCKKNISKYVSIYHDYPLYEFTLSVKK